MYSVAIIGAGNIAAGFDSFSTNKILTHAHAVSVSEVFGLKGFYDLDKKKAEYAAKKWGTRAYDALEELVVDADVCVCCVPDRYHSSVIEELIKYNPRIIITEKPLASTLEEAIKIQEYCSTSCPIAVNYSRRYISDFQRLKQEIGEYDRLIKGVGYYGKGTFHNGSHLVDLLQFFFGKVDYVKKTGIAIHDLENDPTCDAVLGWNNKNIYILGVDSRAITVFEIDLLFENARIRILDGGQRIEKYIRNESEDYEGYYVYNLSDVTKVDYSQALTGLYSNVYNHLNGVEELLCGLSEGVSVLEICDRISGYE